MRAAWAVWAVLVAVVGVLVGPVPGAGAATLGSVTVTMSGSTIDRATSAIVVEYSGLTTPLRVSGEDATGDTASFTLDPSATSATWSAAGVPDGSYVLYGRENAQLATDLYVGTVTIDRQRAKITRPVMSSRVYPAVDGYLDSLTIRSTTDELAGSYQAYIYSAGTLVRVLAMTRDGHDLSAVWTGRQSAQFGWKVGYGHFGVRVVATTDKGSVWSRYGWATVSPGRLRARHYAHSFTAQGAVAAAAWGTCSSVVRLTGRAIGLRSDSVRNCSAGTNSDYAGAVYSIALVKAARYGAARVTATGAGVGADDTAWLSFVYRRNGTWWGDHWVQLGASADGGTMRWAKIVPQSGRLRWLTEADGGSSYDVSSFTISYDYWVVG